MFMCVWGGGGERERERERWREGRRDVCMSFSGNKKMQVLAI